MGIGVEVAVGSAVAVGDGASVGASSATCIGGGSGDVQAIADTMRESETVTTDSNRRRFEFTIGLHAIFLFCALGGTSPRARDFAHTGVSSYYIRCSLKQTLTEANYESHWTNKEIL